MSYVIGQGFVRVGLIIACWCSFYITLVINAGLLSRRWLLLEFDFVIEYISY